MVKRIVGVQDGALFSPACGAIPTQAKQPPEKRLHQIFKELCDVIARWKPAEVAVEEPFVGANVRSAFAVGEARAIALLASAQAGLAASGYAPTEVKFIAPNQAKTITTAARAKRRARVGLKPAYENSCKLPPCQLGRARRVIAERQVNHIGRLKGKTICFGPRRRIFSCLRQLPLAPNFDSRCAPARSMVTSGCAIRKRSFNDE